MVQMHFFVDRRHTFTVSAAEARRSTSCGENAIVRMHETCPRNTTSHSCSCPDKRHTRTVSSSPPEAKMSSLQKEKAALRTIRVCPSRVHTSSDVLRFQTPTSIAPQNATSSLLQCDTATSDTDIVEVPPLRKVRSG
mmetsp:Transcript_53843/g.127119  ORF Transcript_53843/g.127119 Transcript_53843/m.127119 type:complete len:137 (+) Transcript_53843:595-1005(+)